jgi:hypothetical protein
MPNSCRAPAPKADMLTSEPAGAEETAAVANICKYLCAGEPQIFHLGVIGVTLTNSQNLGNSS